MSRSIVIYREKLPNFDYVKPESLEELLRLKDECRAECVILAGGTDLILDMRMGMKAPKKVIDIKGVKELRELKYEEGNGMSIGALVTLRELELNEVVREKYYVLWDAVRKMADTALRERATLAGNIANASPAADSAPPLLVLQAEVELASVNGTRRVPLRKFFKWVKQTHMEDNEIITKIVIPEPPPETSGEYFKAVRSSEDLAIVGIAALVSKPEDPSKRIVRLAYASVAPTPLLIEKVEDIFRQDRPLKELIREAVELVKSEVSPITDVRGTKEYRMHIVEFGTLYLLRKLLEVR